MNAESILTGVVTGVLTGGITGFLAALYAMRQFKAQRAFDRQLDWYERTARALGTLAQVHTEYRFAETPDRKTKVSEDLQKGLLNLEHCMNEAVLYGEQASYEQLNEMSFKYWKAGGGREPINESAAVEVLRANLIDLSKPVRKMLGLKEIRKHQ